MIIFINHNTVDPPSMTTRFLFLPEWSQWTTWSETCEECRGENRRRTRVKCDENDDDTVVIDTNAEDCPGELQTIVFSPAFQIIPPVCILI